MGEIRMDERGTAYMDVPWMLQKSGSRVRTVVPGMEFEDFKSEPLAQAIMKGYQYARMLESGKFDTVLELAQALKCDRSAVARTLSLVNLCPEVVKAVFEGTAPESLTLRKVMYGFPDDWEEQKRVLGLL